MPAQISRYYWKIIAILSVVILDFSDKNVMLDQEC